MEKTPYGYDWHVFDWNDEDIKHLDEVYVAVISVLIIGMLLGWGLVLVWM